MIFLKKPLDIFALISYQSEDNSYRLTVFSEESVPLFGPSLPCPPVFKDPQAFREFLLVKSKYCFIFSIFNHFGLVWSIIVTISSLNGA